MNDVTKIRREELVERVGNLDWDQEFSLQETYKDLGFSTFQKAEEALERSMEKGEISKDVLLNSKVKQNIFGSGGHNRKDYTIKLKPYMKFVAFIHTKVGQKFRSELVEVYSRVAEMKNSGAAIITRADFNLMHMDFVNEFNLVQTSFNLMEKEVKSVNSQIKLIRKDVNKRDKDVLRDILKESTKKMFDFYGPRPDYPQIVDAINIRVSGMTATFCKKQFGLSPRDYDFKYKLDRLEHYLKIQDVLNALNKVLAIWTFDTIKNIIEKIDLT